MERMGLAASAMGDSHRAVDWFEKALEVARRVGDQHQEANLLWLEGIQLAELDQRDAAIARAQEAIALYTKLGKPQASWYGAYLQKYRMGLFDNEPAPAALGVSAGPEAFLGGSLVAGVMAGPAPARRGPIPRGRPDPACSAWRSPPPGPWRSSPARASRRPRPTSSAAGSDLRHLRAPHRHALQDLRLLHRRQEPAAPRVLPDRQVAGLRR